MIFSFDTLEFWLKFVVAVAVNAVVGPKWLSIIDN